MNAVVRLVFLLVLAFIAGQSWGLVVMSPDSSHRYDWIGTTDDTQNYDYGVASNLRASDNVKDSLGFAGNDRGTSFFAFVDGLVVTKGPLWTSTKSKSAVENAFGHYKKHKGEFPEFQNAKQYVEGTQKFLNSPPKGTLTKTRSNGDTLLYDPKTNTFGVKDANGAPRTMFRPKDGMDYWNKQ